jgi:hypothetical protein
MIGVNDVTSERVFAQVGVLSDTCSGVTQTPRVFTHTVSPLPGKSGAVR